MNLRIEILNLLKWIENSNLLLLLLVLPYPWNSLHVLYFTLHTMLVFIIFVFLELGLDKQLLQLSSTWHEWQPQLWLCFSGWCIGSCSPTSKTPLPSTASTCRHRGAVRPRRQWPGSPACVFIPCWRLSDLSGLSCGGSDWSKFTFGSFSVYMSSKCYCYFSLTHVLSYRQRIHTINIIVYVFTFTRYFYLTLLF